MIPHVMGLLSLCATATEPVLGGVHAPQLESSPCFLHLEKAHTQQGRPACVSAESLQACLTLCGPYGQDPSPPGSCLWKSSGKNTGVGCHALLQKIFLTQGSNLHILCLLHCGRFFTTGPPGKPLAYSSYSINN